MPDVTNMTDDDASHAIYLQYRRTKKHWRKFTGRPVRKFRRKFKKWMRRGKGRGRGHGRGQRGNHQRGFMLTWTRSDIDAYVVSRPRGAKGFGRRKNPKDRHGNIMECIICNSEEHFRAKCPQNRDRGAAGAAQASFSGLTYGAYPAFNESHRAEGEDDTPPWGNLDSDQFVTTTDVFATNFGAVDPLQTTDPWASTFQHNRPPF